MGRVAALSWIDSTSGPEHSPEWKSLCKSKMPFICFVPRLIDFAVSGKEYGVGTGTHKHLARGVAATLALEVLKCEAESEQGDKLD